MRTRPVLSAYPKIRFFAKAIGILKNRFASDATPGYRKDGPVSYARFHADPARTDLNVVRQRDAARVVEAFLSQLATLQEGTE